jgi:hypothetical protein
MKVVRSTNDYKMRAISAPHFPFLVWTKNSD